MSNSNSWNSIDDYREMKLLEAGKILLVRPKSAQTVVPLFCKFCRYPMRNSADALAFRRSGCCELCFVASDGKPLEMNPKAWEEYLAERRLVVPPIFNIK